jgi:hypothetical protein
MQASYTIGYTPEHQYLTPIQDTPVQGSAEIPFRSALRDMLKDGADLTHEVQTKLRFNFCLCVL